MRNRNQLVLAEQVNSHDFFYTQNANQGELLQCQSETRLGIPTRTKCICSTIEVPRGQLHNAIQDPLKGLPENMSSTTFFAMWISMTITKETLQFFQPICFLIQTGYLQPFRTS